MRRSASMGISHGPVSICLSQVGVLTKWLNESSWLLAWELHSIHPTTPPSSTTVLKGNSGIYKKSEYFPNSRRRKFYFTYWSLKRVINFTWKRWMLRAWSTGPSSMNKADHSSELWYLSTRYHSNHRALSTAQFHRAGQLATADTCVLSVALEPDYN